MNRNLTADRVRHLLVADFRNHARAGNRLFNHLWTPLAAADRPAWALHADFFGAAGIAWINDAFFNNRTGDMSCFRDPFPRTFLNSFAFSDWLTDGVTDIFVAGLCFRAAGCGADVFVAGLVDRLADIVTNRAMAGLIHGLADRIALFAIAGLIDGLAHTAGDIAVAGLIHRLAGGARDGAVAGLIYRFADRVTLITVAGFIDVPGA